MAKPKSVYSCNACGTISSKWSGKCEQCGTWDSITEETAEGGYRPAGNNKSSHKGNVIAFSALSGDIAEAPRLTTGIAEFDRVLGGGIVKGSAILIGGDPGIGKSTLLLQLLASIAQAGKKAVYITGEESVNQVRLRAMRLGVGEAPVELASTTSVKDIVSTLDYQYAADVVVIDSIQTMYIDSIDSAPGTVSQVRGAAHELIRLAKQRNMAVFLVGHVTKEGSIAGPKLLEHMVDTVLYFEGDTGHHFRLLRAVKNRFGAANEIGVFEMKDKGLAEVPNPSALFLSERGENVSGSVVFAGLEGTRPVLVEVQALVSPSMMATPRRAVIGWDQNRLAMILAVLQTRYGVSFGDQEVFLNVAGGLKITEPACDLAVAAALLSSFYNKPIDIHTAFFGEVGLSGEIRKVSQAELRIKEAEKLGFKRIIAPPSVGGNSAASKNHVSHMALSHVKQLADLW